MLPRLLFLTALLASLTNGFVSPTRTVVPAKHGNEQRSLDALSIRHPSPLSVNQPSSNKIGSLAASINKDNDESSDTPSISVNPYFAAAWIALFAWAFTVAPGSLASEQDAALLQAVIDNPVAPGINELYYTAFNLFAVIPVILANIAVPQGRRQGLPAAPFLAASAAIGFFAAGPYLALRAPPRTTLQGETVSGFTRKVLENKVLNWFIVAFTLYLPIAANVIPALQADPEGLWNDFVQLVTTSRFVAVSLADLTILYVSAVALTPRDYLLRKPEASEQEARNVALASALLPILGSAIYCALRPALPETEE